MVGLFMLVQLFGFLLLLMAFVAKQLLDLPSGSRVNLVLNLVGASLLAVDALANRQWALLPSSADGPWLRYTPSPVPTQKASHLRPRIAAPRPGRGKASAFSLQKRKLTVCKVANCTGVDLNSPYVFTVRTDQEASLVCPANMVPARPWNAATAGGPSASKAFSIFRSLASWRRLPQFWQTRA